jgi:tetratricopeptide (TPR) repeat protein
MRRFLLPCLLVLIACGPFFYQAPPSIGSYPERHAAKRWQHLLEEVAPLNPQLPDEKAQEEELRALPGVLISTVPADRLAVIDAMLDRNRNSGDYSGRRASLLLEIREITTDAAVFDAAGEYLAWRVENFHTYPHSPSLSKSWNITEEEFQKLLEASRAKASVELAAFDQLAAPAPPSLHPYWQVRRAAFFFDRRDYADAAAGFAATRDAYPKHPRGEVAALMVGRSLIEQSRALRQAERGIRIHEQEIANLLNEAHAALEAYLKNFPTGRFVQDAHGWMGAVHHDRGELGAAVAKQVTRLEIKPTREVTRTVLRECDHIFEQLLETAGDDSETWIDPVSKFDAKAVAKHPVIARLFLQHCVDPLAHVSIPLWWENDYDGGRETIDFLNRRILRPSEFVRNALEQLGAEVVAIHGNHDPVTLTLLAWVATEQGEHEQAISLLDRVAPDKMTDETWQARAIILQRLDRHAQAVEAYESLESRFPQSPLLNEVPFRKVISLHRAGDSAQSIVNLLPLVYTKDWRNVQIHLHQHDELIQWLDTLVQFSPLDTLIKAHADTSLRDEHRNYLVNAIRMRALQDGRFDVAHGRLTPDGEVSTVQEYWIFQHALGNPQMTNAQWEERVAPLAAVENQLAAGPPESERHRLHLEAARLWRDRRGLLTLPMVFLSTYAKSEEAKQDLLRRRNGLLLGFSRETVHAALDGRDEATHALEHALKAATSGSPAIAAPALELANECLFRRAEFSLYQKSRAVETGASALSADIHQQLRERFPQSPEAKRAVAYAFDPHNGPWMPGDYNPDNAASEAMAAMAGPVTEAEEDGQQALRNFNLDDLLDFNAETPMENVRSTLAEASLAFGQLRIHGNPNWPDHELATLNRIDDLTAAASLKNISTQDFIHYKSGRHDSLPPAFASLIDFRNRLVLKRDEHGFETVPMNDTIEGWQEFLNVYPDSPKAESASFRLTRLIARQQRGTRRISAYRFPEAPIPGGYKRVTVERVHPDGTPRDVLDAIAQHEKRFPKKRYQDDLNLLRAGALIDAGEYKNALVLLDGILTNPVQKDLHVMAALDFMDVAQRLLVTKERIAAAEALRSTPNAMERLQKLVEGDTFLSRLQPLMPWLKDVPPR